MHLKQLIICFLTSLISFSGAILNKVIMRFFIIFDSILVNTLSCWVNFFRFMSYCSINTVLPSLERAEDCRDFGKVIQAGDVIQRKLVFPQKVDMVPPQSGDV